MMSRRVFLSGTGASLGFAAAAAAQTFPERPIKIITAGIPGTTFDLVARAVGDKLSPVLRQPILVESRPGAAGNLGAEFVAKVPADGYTLLMALSTVFTINPSLYKKPQFDPRTDFRYIAITSATSTTLAVH